MNQKDYKAIAKIIKKHLYDIKPIANDLADYFEKKDITKAIYDEEQGGYYTRPSSFNREQFLKDCGCEMKPEPLKDKIDLKMKCQDCGCELEQTESDIEEDRKTALCQKCYDKMIEKSNLED